MNDWIRIGQAELNERVARLEATVARLDYDKSRMDRWIRSLEAELDERLPGLEFDHYLGKEEK